jgi:hypothetical protein
VHLIGQDIPAVGAGCVSCSSFVKDRFQHFSPLPLSACAAQLNGCPFREIVHGCDWVGTAEAHKHIVRRVLYASIWFVELAGCLRGKFRK